MLKVIKTWLYTTRKKDRKIKELETEIEKLKGYLNNCYKIATRNLEN